MGTDRPPLAGGRLRLLVVARWFPAYDDPARGGFVADQVAALAATGAVEPRVASFEPVTVRGTPVELEAQRSAVQRRFGSAVHARPEALTARGFPGPEGVPVARLPVVSSADIESDRPRQAADHLEALRPFATGPGAWNGRPDVIHAHTAYPDGAASARLGAAIGVPVVITEHSSGLQELLTEPEVHAQYVRALGGAARIVAVSELMAATIREIHPEVADRLVVIPNAIPTALFARDSAHGRSVDVDELLWVGSRSEAKGTPTLLRAFARVRAVRPSARLRLIGAARPVEDEERWQRMAEDLGVAAFVSFEPPVSREGVAAAMARAILFVHPSRSETFGVVAAEALASGTPVVATRSGGVEEILGPDCAASGALVPVDDDRALAAAIVETLDRRDAFDPARLRESVEGRYAAEIVARRLTALYEEVLAERRRSPGRRVGGFATLAGGLPGHRSPRAELPVGQLQVGQLTVGQLLAADELPALVIGFNRTRAARLLESLPADLLARLTVVTQALRDGATLPAGVGRIVEADLLAGERDAVTTLTAANRAGAGPSGRVLGWPRRRILRRRVRWAHDHPQKMRLLTAQRAVPAGFPEERRTGCPLRQGRTLDVLCLDGYDVLACEPLIRSGKLRLSPGGLRWLADRWAATGPSDSGLALAAEAPGVPQPPRPPPNRRAAGLPWLPRPPVSLSRRRRRRRPPSDGRPR